MTGKTGNWLPGQVAPARLDMLGSQGIQVTSGTFTVNVVLVAVSTAKNREIVLRNS